MHAISLNPICKKRARRMRAAKPEFSASHKPSVLTFSSKLHSAKTVAPNSNQPHEWIIPPDENFACNNKPGK